MVAYRWLSPSTPLNRFRLDLYYRLNVFPIEVAPQGAGSGHPWSRCPLSTTSLTDVEAPLSHLDSGRRPAAGEL